MSDNNIERIQALYLECQQALNDSDYTEAVRLMNQLQPELESYFRLSSHENDELELLQEINTFLNTKAEALAIDSEETKQQLIGLKKAKKMKQAYK